MKRKYLKFFSVFVMLNFLVEIFYPAAAFALSGGPSQPEHSSFEPVQTTQMVDPFSGDFTYNIPLMDVGGYPLNIAYNSGVSMDQEASWVGLGWNINPGTLNRMMRGIPDEFAGDEIIRRFNMKTNYTLGFDMGIEAEFFGLKSEKLKEKLTEKSKVSVGLAFNSFKGMGMTVGANSALEHANGIGLNAGLSMGTFEGVSMSASASAQMLFNTESNFKATHSLTGSYNSRAGLQSLSLSSSLSKDFTAKTEGKPDKTGPGSFASANLSSISFSPNTYSPPSEFSFSNLSVNFSGGFGPDIFGFDPGIFPSGYYTHQKLAKKTENIPAYGYLTNSSKVEISSEIKKRDSGILLDFNRDGDGMVRKESKYVGSAFFTHDVFHYSAQGTGGSFRPFKSHVDFVYDRPARNSAGRSFSLGVEAHGGSLTKFGGNLVFGISNSQSNIWDENNMLLDEIIANNKSIEDHHSFYFRNTGEKTPIDQEYFDEWGGAEAVAPQILLSGKNAMIRPLLKYTSPQGLAIDDNYSRGKDKRNVSIGYLYARDAVKGSIRKFQSYPDTIFTDVWDEIVDLARVDENRKSHHISEYTVTTPEGMRYVYGIPAYNIEHIERSFSVKKTGVCTTGLVEISALEATIHNGSGRDNFFYSNELPPYAHSFLLTSVLSPDYVDLRGDGMSDDDLGNYIKLNYNQAYGASNPYKWRVPFEKNQANYNPGFQSDELDNKGNYIYGEKEIWYVHSIETKTHIAEFHLSAREDAYGVKDIDGGGDTLKPMKKLDKIVLYAKSDRLINGAGAVPVKTVHFIYDYSLCKGIPNSLYAIRDEEAPDGVFGGKLTLKEIYFTYGNSERGKYSKYKFTYGTGELNPDYSLKGYDRWGNFKPDDCELPNMEFPYTLQDREKSDKYAQAWSLQEISLPTGGTIKVQYEADDYAYVQNRAAAEMVMLEALSSGPAIAGQNPKNYLYNGSIRLRSAVENNYLHFKIKDGISTKEELGEKYIAPLLNDHDGKLYLYYKFSVNIGGKYGSNWEYVSGYCEVEDWGLSDSPDHAWVKVKLVPVGDRNSSKGVHPIAKQAWQFTRLYLPQKIYPNTDKFGENIYPFGGLVGILKDIRNMFGGFNRGMRTENYGKVVDIEKSWMRLGSTEKSKIGGGARVKQIILQDNWSQMKGQFDAEYIQEFDYTMVENGITISSGVASYEPMVGNEENPWRRPVFYETKNHWAPDDLHYDETPHAESQFPGASVGYRKVTVRQINSKRPWENITGFTEHQFFTYYDFPVRSEATGIKLDFPNYDPNKDFLHYAILNSLSPVKREYINIAQGFVVELNDMHGKPKSQMIYGHDSVVISGTKYHYKSSGGKLNNLVKTITKAGVMEDQIVARDIDVLFDFRESTSESTSGGVALNINVPLNIFPVPIPCPFPVYQSSKTRSRVAVATKVIQTYGVLEKTEVITRNSVTEITPTLYDAETGEVLLTRAVDQYSKAIHKFTYPAHWAYDKMGPAYMNLNERTDLNKYAGDDKFYVSNADGIFAHGDRVLLYPNTEDIGPGDGMVKYVVKVETDGVFFLSPDGKPMSEGFYSAVIISSGRKNQQNTPVGEVSLLSNPIADGINLKLNEQVVNASAVEYDDFWATLCNKINFLTCSDLTDEANDLAAVLDELAREGELSSTSVRPLGSETVDVSGNSNYRNSLKDYVDDCCISQEIDPCYHYFWYDSLVSGASNSPYTDKYSLKRRVFFGYEEYCHCAVEFDVVDPELYFQDFNKSKISFNEIDSFNNMRQDPFYLQAGVNYYFLIDGWSDGKKVIFRGKSDCYPIVNCEYECLYDSLASDINPYTSGIRGNWRTKQTLAYLTDRNQNNNLNLSKEGTYKTYTPYWTPSGTPGNDWNPSSNINWVAPEEMTIYDPMGNALESKDALGRYSAAIYEYNNTEPIAVAGNSRYRQIYNQNFEIYDYGYQFLCTRAAGFEFIQDDTATYLADYSHTGVRSFKMGSTVDSFAWEAPIVSCGFDDTYLEGIDLGYPLLDLQVKCEDCIGQFAPDAGEKYVVSAWVSKNNDTLLQIDDIYLKVEFETPGGTQHVVCDASGPVIDGWQRISEVIEIPGDATVFRFKLMTASGVNGYFDDLRVHPYNSNMKAFVYHPHTLKLLAEMDENNYATFYEYDAEGQLIRVKKETERGNYTIKESRSSTKKQ